jgi:hypothetical protein
MGNTQSIASYVVIGLCRGFPALHQSVHSYIKNAITEDLLLALLAKSFDVDPTKNRPKLNPLLCTAATGPDF